jgi:hypothetical protein
MRNDLFQPVRLGPYRLANRIVMAPLTRSRAGTDGAASSIMAEYYGQRATAGLIIAEATNISPQARGYAFTPGLYTAAQVEAWRLVTEAVHAKAGRIFVQLWHVGRVSHPSLQPAGALPVAPSAIRPDATVEDLARQRAQQACRQARPGREGQPHMAISGSSERSFLSSGMSVMVASVSKSTLATDTAFSNAMRTTLVGSMIPTSTRSTYSLRAASKP